MTYRVDSSRRQPSLLVDLVVGLYALGTGVTAVFSIGWAIAPFENMGPNTAHELLLVGLALAAVVSAVAMGRAAGAGNSVRAWRAFGASLVCLGFWAIALPPV
jgi:hypothetical protein